MPVVRVDDPADPRLADYARLSDAELLRARQLFVAEGRLVVERVIADPAFNLRSVLLSEAAHRALQPLLARLAAATPIYVIAAGDFLPLTGFNIHRGCLALVERPPARSAAALAQGARTLVVLEAVTNADNVGGVFRNAAAFQGDGVLLSPTCCDPLYRKAVRTSMAATLQVPFARLEAWPGELSMLKASGFTLVALTPRGGSTTLDEFSAGPRPGRIAILVGTEGAGLSAAAEAIADHRVRIPISNRVDSLNLAVATGIALSRLSLGRPL
ncbi:MAG TPA: RNA methyltransferase [Vicinamibacterales bacterium]|jgi:tRNA G18 (ribose-2'-O)-methylase SpoU